jgi:hypothetical protein
MKQDLDIYISFWGFKEFDPLSLDDYFSFIRDCMIVSQNKAAEHYNNVYLVTDSKSLPMFSDIPFTKIYTDLDELNDIDKRYHRYWCLGKIKTMELAAEKKRPFVQIDYDVFLNKPLPNRITSSDLFCQSPEPVNVYSYNLNLFYENYNHLGYAKDRVEDAFNCGIFGCNDFEFINKFCKSALDFIFHTDNEWVLEVLNESKAYGGYYNKLGISTKEHLAGFQCAIWAEQYYLACAAKKEGIEVKFLFERPLYENVDLALKLSNEYGYIHLLSGKEDPNIRAHVKSLANKIVYNS